MEEKAEIIKCIEPILQQFDVILYDIKWVNEKKNKILQIAIMKDDGSMDIDTCADVSEKISEALDNQNLIQSEYFLEVCSPGAERILRSKDEVLKVIGKHVYVKFNHLIKNNIEVQGDLLSFIDNELTVSYRDKALTKKIIFSYEDIELIRLAVKF